MHLFTSRLLPVQVGDCIYIWFKDYQNCQAWPANSRPAIVICAGVFTFRVLELFLSLILLIRCCSLSRSTGTCPIAVPQGLHIPADKVGSLTGMLQLAESWLLRIPETHSTSLAQTRLRTENQRPAQENLEPRATYKSLSWTLPRPLFVPSSLLQFPCFGTFAHSCRLNLTL